MGGTLVAKSFNQLNDFPNFVTSDGINSQIQKSENLPIKKSFCHWFYPCVDHSVFLTEINRNVLLLKKKTIFTIRSFSVSFDFISEF